MHLPTGVASTPWGTKLWSAKEEPTETKHQCWWPNTVFLLLLGATHTIGPQQIYVLCKPLVPGLPALLGSPGGSKENRDTCLSKHCWFLSPAVSSKQDWSKHLSLPLHPLFTRCLCICRRAQSAAALSVRRCHLICPFQHSSSFDPLLSSCSFHGLRSTAGNSLAEIIYQMGEGCFIIISSTSASFMKRSGGVHPN